MTPELTVLALAGLLQVIQYVLVSVPANLELGPKVTLAPRDSGALVDQVTPRTARLARAMQNHFEALILFTLAVVVVTLSQTASPTTATLAWVFLIARALYVPAYAFGWVPWRSLIWMAGFGATAAMLLLALM